MGRLIYITGPVRSGKSRRAVDIARAWGGGVVYVATFRPGATPDAEMEDRIRKHRAERPAWRTLEAPQDIAGALIAMVPTPAGALVDSLTLWATDRWEKAEADIFSEWTEQLASLREAPWPVVIVGDEIGWTPVPVDPAMRRFRDITGTLGQQTAATADEAWLMVAGCPLRLK